MARVTQAEVAALAGTSQSTVSLVLNDAAAGRVAPETVERVVTALRTSGYLRQRTSRLDHGRIIGVFTYESVFPSVAADFFHPFLTGLERAAEASRVDLLLFTSAHDRAGRRRFLREDQLRRVDGCVLLGREVHPDDLRQLNATGYPYVSVGRRDEVDGPIAHVAADYVQATRELVTAVLERGHRRLLYASCGAVAESTRDRWTGYQQAIAGTAVSSTRLDRATSADLLAHVDRDGTSCVIFDEARDAEAFARRCLRDGRTLGTDLSIVLLHEPIRPLAGVDLTHFTIPRIDMGRDAVELLLDLLDAEPDIPRTRFQRLFPVGVHHGTSLGAPAS